MSTVADIMNPKLLYIRDGDRLSTARSQILRFGVTAVPVLDETHRPVGLVSLRDLSVDEDGVKVSAPAVTVKASASIEEGARRLAETNYHSLVVVDDRGIAVGMASAVDFLRAMLHLAPRHPPSFEGY
jgi:CBS-domain-containing membrane protein